LIHGAPSGAPSGAQNPGGQAGPSTGDLSGASQGLPTAFPPLPTAKAASEHLQEASAHLRADNDPSHSCQDATECEGLLHSGALGTARQWVPTTRGMWKAGVQSLSAFQSQVEGRMVGAWPCLPQFGGRGGSAEHPSSCLARDAPPRLVRQGPPPRSVPDVPPRSVPDVKWCRPRARIIVPRPKTPVEALKTFQQERPDLRPSWALLFWQRQQRRRRRRYLAVVEAVTAVAGSRHGQRWPS